MKNNNPNWTFEGWAKYPYRVGRSFVTHSTWAPRDPRLEVVTAGRIVLTRDQKALHWTAFGPELEWIESGWVLVVTNVEEAIEQAKKAVEKALGVLEGEAA